MKYEKNNDPKWIGQRFGKLTVTGFINKNRRWYWRCKCDCGNEITTSASNVKMGYSRSCGCVFPEKMREKLTTHGMSGTSINTIYKAMKSRCYNPQNKAYKHYGGRGIKICKDWLENGGEKFYKWALDNGYMKGLSIERIDVDGDYCPENCKWITMAEQTRNRTDSLIFEYNGEKKCLSEWCRVFGVEEMYIRARINKGMSFEDAMFTPKKEGHILEQCKERGVNYRTVLSRMRNQGMCLEEAMSKSVRPCNIAKRCREAGINYSTVIARMRNHGMTLEEAIQYQKGKRLGPKITKPKKKSASAHSDEKSNKSLDFPTEKG